MMWFKACPRCKRGDMTLDRDVDGESRICVQCGYREELTPANAVGRSVPLEVLNPHYSPNIVSPSA